MTADLPQSKDAERKRKRADYMKRYFASDKGKASLKAAKARHYAKNRQRLIEERHKYNRRYTAELRDGYVSYILRRKGVEPSPERIKQNRALTLVKRASRTLRLLAYGSRN